MTDPKASCRHGYTEEDLTVLLGPRHTEFLRWMIGQTISVCDGWGYNHELSEYEPTNCGPHGWVYYTWDVQRFIDGLPVID